MTVPVDAPNAKPSAAKVAGKSMSVPNRQLRTTDSQLCWLEVRQYNYQPDHQVELLHLQAEADALLLQLQALSRRRQSAEANT